MQKHEIMDYKDAQSKIVPGAGDVSYRNRSLKELTLARALYKCGDKNNLGKNTLEKYSNSLEALYSEFADKTLNS